MFFAIDSKAPETFICSLTGQNDGKELSGPPCAHSTLHGRWSGIIYDIL